VSRIGERIDQPAIVDIATAALPYDRLQARIEDIVRSELSRFAELRDELVAGRVATF
jgi:S-adenosylmethionine synthetase